MKTNYHKSLGQILIACVLCNVIEALAVERYVNVNNPTPAAPHLTWATAATNIQAAINIASDGDIITVTNGVYQTGGSLLLFARGTNRVSISKALLVQSVNGPVVTIIDGGGAMCCVALASNAVLSGFTLANGSRTDGDPDAAGAGARGVSFYFRSSTLTNCILTANAGGAAHGCTLNNCILTNNVNSGVWGGGDVSGGASYCTLNNCLITGNRTVHAGGGALWSTLNNCIVSNNFADTGGGTYKSIANDCIIVNNVASRSGGGSADLAVTNCFIGGNLVSNVSSSVSVSGGGAGGLSEPQTYVNCAFVNNCVIGTNGAGGGVAGVFTRLYHCAFTNNSASAGGGASHGQLYDCILVGNQATNGIGLGGGVVGGAAGGSGFDVVRLERCLLLGNSAKNGGGVGAGGRFGNSGVDTYKCAFSGNSASVAGGGIHGRGSHRFAVIKNNFAGEGGGFASGDGASSFYMCQFSGNVATNLGGALLGAGSLEYCTIAGNSAGMEGGGVSSAQSISIYYSIIYHNSAPLHPNCNTNSFGVAYFTCTTPMPAIGNYNVTNDPVFVNLAAGNYHLSSNSPCINHVYVPYPPDPQSIYPDLAGNPRRVGGGFDLGAYEFQYPLSVISYQWLQQHGLPTDGSADYSDTDGDSFNNFSEWRIRTDPLDAASLLKLDSISVVTDPEDPTQQFIRLEWPSVPGVDYSIDIANDVTGPFIGWGSATATSTNTIWEMPLDVNERSLFFKVGAP